MFSCVRYMRSIYIGNTYKLTSSHKGQFTYKLLSLGGLSSFLLLYWKKMLGPILLTGLGKRFGEKKHVGIKHTTLYKCVLITDLLNSKRRMLSSVDHKTFNFKIYYFEESF